jgi:hypothetical protein
MRDKVTFVGALLPRAIAICLLTCSCAGDLAYKKDEAKLQFSTVAIVTPEDIVAIEAVESNFSTPVRGAAHGSAGGTIGGAMVGALACGPYLYGICVMGMGYAGMIVGGVGGALYGFSGVSEEDSLYIMEEMAHLNQHRDFQHELAAGVASKLPDGLVSTPLIADAQAITTINSIEFVQKKDTVYMEVTATVTIATQELEGESLEAKHELQVESKKADIDDWLRTGSRELEDSVNECLDELISDMTSVILEYHTPRLSGL